MTEREYGCLMADFAISEWGQMITNLIPKEDLYTNEDKEYGYEHEPHVTILFGLISDKIKDENVKAATVPLSQCAVQFNEIDSFSNEEYDVVHFKVFSPALNLMNMRATALPHKNARPDYNSHVTIAYVKPGLGEKYKKKIKSFMLIPFQYSYSKPDGSKIYFKK